MTTILNIKNFILKKGNLAVSQNYIGAIGEITYDTTLGTIRVHDGAFPGGNIMLNTAPIANLQAQIDYIKSNLDSTALDSIAEIAAFAANVQANVVIEANTRATVDSSLQTQINSLIGDKGNIRNGNNTVSLSATTGNLIMPYVDWSLGPLPNAGKNIVWNTSEANLFIGPIKTVATGTALHFGVGNNVVIFDHVGTLHAANVLLGGNVSIDANGIVINTSTGPGQHRFEHRGNIIIAAETTIQTEDSPTMALPTSGLTIRTGRTNIGDTGSITISTGGTTYGDAGNLTLEAASTTNGAGGVVFIRAGATVNGDGGDVRINSGNSVTDLPGHGGDMLLTLGTAVSGDGGEFIVAAGSTTNGNGGQVRITAGSTSLGDAGGFTFTAGHTNSGQAGSFALFAGNSNVGAAGNVRIIAGDAYNAAQAGDITIRAGSNFTNSLYHGRINLITAGGTTQLNSDGSAVLPGSLSIGGNLAVPNNLTVGQSLVVSGDFTVIGTTSTVSSTTITVADKNIELAKVSSPTDLTADGAGLTVKGTTDKTLLWLDAIDSWSISEHFNLDLGKQITINNTLVLSSTTLGSGVIYSNLTTVGTVVSGTWQGSIVNSTYGGTGVNNANRLITIGGNLTTAGAYDVTLTLTGTTALTLPVTGTVATLNGTETFNNKTLNTPILDAPTVINHPTIEGVTSTGATGTGRFVFDNTPTLITPVLGVATATTINKVSITAPATGSTLTINDGKTLLVQNTVTFTGNDSITVDLNAGGSVAYKGLGISQFAGTSSAEFMGLITDETGTGLVVFNNTPTLVTPILGAATATTINKLSITTPAVGSTLTVFDGKTLTATNTLTLLGTDGSSVDFSTGGNVAYKGLTLSQFASTSSAELLNLITDETGTGSLVFATSPTLVTPVLGVASATTINKLAITAPATGATLAVADGKTLTASNTLTFTGTDASTANFTTGGTVAYKELTLAQFASTTSAQLLGVISDETGTGSLVFNTSPTLVTPVLGIASATTINKIAITTPAAGATLTLADGKTLTISNTVTMTGTDGSSVNFGPGGTIAYKNETLAQFSTTTSSQLAGIMSDETGTGSLVFANTPTLITPILGVASASSINKLAITAPASGATLTISDGKTLSASNSLTLSGTDGSTVNFGTGGTAAYKNETLSQFAATTSSTLAALITDETGTGSLVFNTSPTLVTPTLGVATATTINKLVITAPATGATLTIAEAKTLAVNNTLTFAGNDAAIVNFGGGGVIIYASSKLSDFATTTSAELRTVVTDNTGTGTLVFNNAPTLIAPTLGVASATSINKVNITPPTNSATLTITDGKTLAVVNTLTFTGTDSSSVAFGTGGTVAYRADKLNVFAPTSSSELAGVLTDETGSGNVVFNNAPTLYSATLINPIITPTVGELIINGNLTVNGNLTTINSTVVTIDDPIFTIGGDTAPVINDGKDRGIEFRYFSGSAKVGFFGFDASTGKLTFIPDATNTAEVFSGTLGNIDVGGVHINGSQIAAANLSNGTTGTGNVVLSTSPTLVTPTLGVATATTINKVAITTPTNGSTLTIADGKVLTTNNTLTFNGVDNSTVQFGSGGTVVYAANNLSVFAATTSAQLAGVISDETGTGNLVFATSPTLVTPTLGVATATTVNKLTITAPVTGATLTIADGKTLSVSNSLTFTGTDASSVAFGAGGTVAYTASNLSVFAATTSSQLAGVISDETGTGKLVFATSPTLVTPNIGAATGTSLSTTGDVTVGGVLGVKKVSETFTALSGASGIVTHDCSLGQVFSHSSISSDFTADLTNLNLTSGNVTTVTMMLNQGATPYMITALRIGGVAQTINWQTGSTPAGIASKKDMVSFTIFNDTGTYTVIAQSITFG